MSLSFVSKTVQTTTEGGDFVEEAIVSKSGADNDGQTSSSTGGTYKPLFEQLRANQEQADAEQEEYQKAMMRGTLALDEDDVAHLESLRRKQREQQDAVNRKTEEELAAFRMARAERSMKTGTMDDTNIASSSAVAVASLSPPPPPQPTETTKKLVAPQIRIKRKRRKDEGEKLSQESNTTSGSDSNTKKSKGTQDEKETQDTASATLRLSSSQPTEGKTTTAGGGGAFGSLLTGYGSSSDDDD
jgi:hypothetical protein